MASRHHNLNNPDSDPAKVPLTVSCRVHFHGSETVPKAKLAEWLDTLPAEATVRFSGHRNGKIEFEATWTEAR